MNLVDQIIKDEGFSPHAYQCPVGRTTVGYGRNIDRNGGKGLTEAEARILLNNDLIECDNDLALLFGGEFWDSLDKVRRYALVNMRFQLGPGRFRGFKNAIEAVRGRKWQAAGAEILDSRYATQVPSRAQRIAFEIIDGISG